MSENTKRKYEKVGICDLKDFIIMSSIGSIIGIVGLFLIVDTTLDLIYPNTYHQIVGWSDGRPAGVIGYVGFIFLIPSIAIFTTIIPDYKSTRETNRRIGQTCQICHKLIKMNQEFKESFDGKNEGVSHYKCARRTNQ